MTSTEVDLSAIEAKYPLAEFSFTLVQDERLGNDKHAGDYAELTARVGEKSHITLLRADDGVTPEILTSLAGGQYSYFKFHGVDLTGNKPGEA